MLLRSRRRGHKNDLSWLGIVELFARFFLDGLGVVLQGFDLVLCRIVFLLELLHFFLQDLVFGFLLTVNHHAVGAKHNMQKQPYGDDENPGSGDATAGLMQFGGVWTDPVSYLFGEGFGVRGMLRQGAQSLFGIGELGDLIRL